MVKKKCTVVWDNEAKVYLKKAIAYIKKESPQNAEKVKKDIIASTKKLADEPERLYAPDKYRTDNDVGRNLDDNSISLKQFFSC